MNETFTEAGSTLKFGTVAAVDEKTMTVRVRLPELDNLRTAWLPVLTRKSKRDKDYWLPDLGEHVAVLLDARGEDGVVLGAIFSEADEVPVASRDKWQRRFADGALVEYDRAAHHYLVDVPAGGEITLRCGASTITITNDGVKAKGLRIDLNEEE